MKKLIGLKKDPDDSRDYKIKSIQEPKILPLSIDWSARMSLVKDQGALGSCVGFAVAAMKEFQEQSEYLDELAHGNRYRREQDHYDLSEAWIYWKSKEIDPWPDEEGTSIRCAMKILNTIGVPCERAYPYNDAYKGRPAYWASLIARWGLIASYWRIETLAELKQELMNGPVVIGIECFEDIFYPDQNGKVKYPQNPDACIGGHAICIVGYNDSTQLVCFKNSWSTSWGKNGYGYLSYDYIRDFMLDAWVAKDLRVTRKTILQ